jgi:hypothetical protein
MDKAHIQPVVCGEMTIVALRGRLHMPWVLTSSGNAIVTAGTVTRGIGVIEADRQPIGL